MAIRGTAAGVGESGLFGDYPFLPGADSVLAGEPLSVRALLEEPVYGRAREIGRARVRAGQDDPRAVGVVEELVAAEPAERYLSFLFARLVLSSAPSAAGLRRWAVAEAKRAYARLQRAGVGEVEEVAQRLGFAVEAGGAGVRIGLADYVRLAAPIREADFRLAAQDVDHGSVRVPTVRAARLLQEAIRRELSVGVPLSPELVGIVRTGEAALLEEVARRLPALVERGRAGPGTLRRDRFPPCIRKMQRTLERGENLSHSGRFCLAAFLHRVGADEETIVDAFRGAPDFDESITRYQVEHISQRDGGRGYEPPECDTLRSHGLCAREGDPDGPQPADRARDPACFEPSLKHPLQYYRRKGGLTTEGPREERGAPPGPATSGRPGTPAR
jgi:DNA primase large subunit